MGKLETIHVSLKDGDGQVIVINKTDYDADIHKIEKRPLINEVSDEEKAEQERIAAENAEAARRAALTDEEREAEDKADEDDDGDSDD